MGDRITLTPAEVDLLWEHLDLGPVPTILSRRRLSPPDAAKRAWKSLADKGLGWPEQIQSTVESRLRRLARPEWELDLRLWHANPDWRGAVLLAANRTSATIAKLDIDEITLTGAPAHRITREAVTLLPAHPPGAGHSVTVPGDLLDAAARRADTNPETLRRVLHARGVGKSEARKIVEAISGVHRLAQFGAAHTPSGGQRVRARHVVGVHDGPHGRYLFTRKPSRDRPWVTLVPGTDTAITRQLDELLHTVSFPGAG